MQSTIARSSFVLILAATAAIAAPPAPQPDPSGVDKNRYISLSVPDNGGEATALRVTLTSLMHPDPPGFATPPDFTAYEGQYRWVGPPQLQIENDNDPTPFVAAPLYCNPFYMDWSTVGVFHVYGDAVVPSSNYDVVSLGADCQGDEENCTDVSSILSLGTARWGDVAEPFQQTGQPVNQPNFVDIARIADKIARNANVQLSKANLQLQAIVPDPARTINILDALFAIDAFRGLSYPFSGPTSCEGGNSRIERGTPEQIRAGNPPLMFSLWVPENDSSHGYTGYPGGTVVLENELRATAGGFHLPFHVRILDWNPDELGPTLRAWQVQIDGDGLLGINADPPAPGVDLTYPIEPCTTSSECDQNLFEYSTCGTIEPNVCASAFVSTNYVYWMFAGTPAIGIASIASPYGPILSAVSLTPQEELPTVNPESRYAGSLILDIPSEAAGHAYTIRFRIAEETFAVGTGAGKLPVDIPLAETTPFVITIGLPGSPVISDPTGINKSRFISFSVAPTNGGETALRVKLASLHHVSPPYTSGISVPFALFEGLTQYVGPPVQYVQSVSSGTPFYASRLVCEPYYHDWTTVGLLHVSGEAIVPSSTFEVEVLAGSCAGAEATCTDVSTPFAIVTARWGDVTESYNPPSSTSQPDFGDIGALVNKFKGSLGAPIKARGLLAETDARGLIDLSVDLGFTHISACVDAFKGFPYPYKPGKCVGTEAIACAADEDCGAAGLCILCP